jgi:hypothetical protein
MKRTFLRGATVIHQRRFKSVTATVCLFGLAAIGLVTAIRLVSDDRNITFVDVRSDGGVVFAQFSIDFDRLPAVKHGWKRRILVGLGERRNRFVGFHYQMPLPDPPKSGDEHYEMILPLVPPNPLVTPNSCLIVEVADTAKNRSGGQIYDQIARSVLDLKLPNSAFRVFNTQVTNAVINNEAGGDVTAGGWITLKFPSHAFERHGDLVVQTHSAKNMKMFELGQVGYAPDELMLHTGKSIMATISYADLGAWSDLQLLGRGWPCRWIEPIEIDEVAMKATFEIKFGKQQEFYLVRRSASLR